MKQGSDANGLILKQIRTKHFNDGDRDGPGIICYTILKMLSLTGKMGRPKPEPDTSAGLRQGLFKAWCSILQSQKCVDSHWRDLCRGVVEEKADEAEGEALIEALRG